MPLLFRKSLLPHNLACALPKEKKFLYQHFIFVRHSWKAFFLSFSLTNIWQHVPIVRKSIISVRIENTNVVITWSAKLAHFFVTCVSLSIPNYTYALTIKKFSTKAHAILLLIHELCFITYKRDTTQSFFHPLIILIYYIKFLGDSAITFVDRVCASKVHHQTRQKFELIVFRYLNIFLWECDVWNASFRKKGNPV